jgi:alanine-synthesizing transaminase
LENKATSLFASRTNWDLTPNALSAALAARRAAGLPVLDLTASNPTECGFTYDSEAILAALGNPASLAYEPVPQGLLVAREAVAGYYAQRGDAVAPADVVLTTSTSEAYSFVFRLLCNPGDEVLVPQPSYPLFDFLADLQDARLVRYPLLYDHGWQIDFHAFQQAITSRTRAVMVVNPNNPTGNFCKPAEGAQLTQICAARGLAILADEVFLDYQLVEPATNVDPPGAPSGIPGVGDAQRALTTPQNHPRSFATNVEALTFTMSGLSKISGLPQMKASWLAVSGPAELKRVALARLEVIADTFLSMNAPVQHALPTLLLTRHALQSELRSRVQSNLSELDRQLAGQVAYTNEKGTCTRLAVEGGWYAVLQLPANRSSEDLAMKVLTGYGVYVHPGHFYDFPTDRAAVVSLITSPRAFATGVQSLLTALS